MKTTIVRAGDRRWYRNVQLSLGLATIAGTALLVAGNVDPRDQMISESAHTVPGAVLLALAACGFAAAGAWLLVGAHRALPQSRLLTAMLVIWCVCLTVVAIFPTNVPGTEPGVTAVLHRLSAGPTAALPPLIALRVAKMARQRAENGRVRWLRAAGWFTLTACVAFGAVNGPAALLDRALPPYAGLGERGLLALMLVVMGLCAWVVEGEDRARPS